MVELVDTRDLKSLEGDFVPVQVRPRVPINNMEEKYSQESLTLFSIWDLIVDNIKEIALVTSIVTISGLIYSLSVQEMYRSDILIAPVSQDSKSGRGSSLQESLGRILPIDLSLSPEKTDQFIEILKSRTFIEDFIRITESKSIIFSNKWDKDNKRWIGSEPSDYKAYINFRKDIMSVNQLPKKNIYKLSVIWYEPEQTKLWANKLISSLNLRERKKAIIEAEKSMGFIQKQKESMPVISLQKSLDDMLLTQLSNSMKANINEEFAFVIIDPAQKPEQKFYPNKTLIVILSFVSGILLSFIYIVFKNLFLNYRIYRNRQ